MKNHFVSTKGTLFVGKRRTFDYTDVDYHESIRSFWRELRADGTLDKLQRLEIGEIKGFIGFVTDTKRDELDEIVDEHKIDYWICVQQAGYPTNDWDWMMLPPADWLPLEVEEGSIDSLQEIKNYLSVDWLQQQDLKHAGWPDLEVYTSYGPIGDVFPLTVWVPVQTTKED
ncbi:MAG: GyrI-like domain-containing protein [Bacilli bacterium]